MTGTGLPIVTLTLGGRDWPAIVDTGFNGDLELPEDLRLLVNPRPHTQIYSVLAAGQSLIEDTYLIDLTFDGEVITAEVTFAPGTEILIGTSLLRRRRLEIDFVARTVLLERVP